MHPCLHLGSGPSHKVYRKAVLEVDLEFSSTKVHNLCSRGWPGVWPTRHPIFLGSGGQPRDWQHNRSRCRLEWENSVGWWPAVTLVCEDPPCRPGLGLAGTLDVACRTRQGRTTRLLERVLGPSNKDRRQLKWSFRSSRKRRLEHISRTSTGNTRRLYELSSFHNWRK